MNSQNKYLALTTTVPSADDAQAIARALVEQRLAACVQISSPITSIYRWENQLETSTEYSLTAKTTVDAFQRAKSTICELHPYDVPEVLAAPIVAGHAKYLTWLEGEIG